MITHFPGVISAKSADLKSLDLIFAPFRDVHCFAIRCHIQENEETSYLLLGPKFFDDIEEPALQTYLASDTVLSFGRDYRFDIDVTPETVAFPDNPEISAGLAKRTSGGPSFHGLTGGVYKAQEHIHRAVADARLLAIPAS